VPVRSLAWHPAQFEVKTAFPRSVLAASIVNGLLGSGQGAQIFMQPLHVAKELIFVLGRRTEEPSAESMTTE
jgi:hypothetical protein